MSILKSNNASLDSPITKTWLLDSGIFDKFSDWTKEQDIYGCFVTAKHQYYDPNIGDDVIRLKVMDRFFFGQPFKGGELKTKKDVMLFVNDVKKVIDEHTKVQQCNHCQ